MNDQPSTVPQGVQEVSATPLADAMVNELSDQFDDFHAIDPDTPRKCQAVIGFLKIVGKMQKDRLDFADEQARDDFRAVVKKALL